MKPNPNSKQYISADSGTTVARRRMQSIFRVVVVVLTMFLPLLASAATGPAVQLLWSVQPGGTPNVGTPLGQQPTLITADANGNPSTIGLASSVVVTVDTIPAGGLDGGARTVDLGTGANNGVYTFNNLQIDSGGGYSLTASTGDGTNGVFSPTNGLSKCVLWLDASDPSTLVATNDASNLSAWMDKSGIGNNATNVNGDGISETPLTNSNPNLPAFAYGGQRVVTFNGTNVLNINLASYLTNSTYSIIALTILNPNETPNNDYYIGSQFNSVNGDDGMDHVLHIGYRDSADYTFAQYADDINVTVAYPLGNFVASEIHSSGQNQVFTNGVLGATATVNNLSGMIQANIGEGNGGLYHGDIAEVIVYRTNLTTLQRVGVENYLDNKWLGQLSSGITSSSFLVGPAPAGLAFSQQPSQTVAGAVISPSVAVTVTNSSGAGISGLTVFVSLASGSGTLGGTLSQVTDVNGIATFTNLSLTVAGQDQLQAAIPGAVTNTSSAFTIVAGTPAQLVVTTQPSTKAVAGIVFTNQPVVAVEDTYGNVCLTASDVITASELAGGNLNATSSNSVQVAAVAGIATYSGLYVTNSGAEKLTFTDNASTNTLTVNSSTITVTTAAFISGGLVIETQPSSTAQVGVPFATQPVVGLFDPYGNPAAANTAITVTASVGNLGGQSYGPVLSAYTANGIATFAGLNSTNLGSVTLTFSNSSVSVNSTAISVGVGPATTVVWTTQPGLAGAGSPFLQQPVLQTADAGGNLSTIGLDADDWVVVHLISGSGLVGNSLTYDIGTSGSNGVITFNNLQINNAGTNDILSADYLGATTNPTNNILEPCFLWLDAYDTNTLIVTNSRVTEWVDKSGTGNNATNTASYPTNRLNSALPAMAYGGQHAVSFIGSRFLRINLTNIINNYYTFFVVDVANAASSGEFIGNAYDGVDGTLAIGYRSSTQFTIQQYADDLNYTAPATFATNTPRLWTARLNSANDDQEIFLNGNGPVASRGVGNYLQAAITGTVGGAGGSGYNGDLAEVIAYSGSLSDAERQTVEQYLIHKWFSNSRAMTSPFVVASLVPTLSIISNGSNTNTDQLMLTGAPGYSYRILSTADLTLPTASWQGVATNTLGGSGVWQLNVTNSQPALFYRAVTP